jgi:tRNA U34 5-methylaminomethyl-2-thiouridine-forming methyltransferase MnmC
MNDLEMKYKDYEAVPTGDGSFTLFSQQYNQCYHSTKDGALVESLHKHVIPAFTTQKSQNTLHILDICFGLGYNTLATLYYNDLHDKKPLKIFSPELDEGMLATLSELEYPIELQEYLPILHTLLESGFYKDDNREIELYRGDARAYIKKFEKSFDIVYQDAFSPDENPALWSVEYFQDIKKTMKESAVLTTYSIALKVRIALDDNDFKVYLYEGNKTRSSSLASLNNIGDSTMFKAIDVKHKRSVNPDIKALSDLTI